MVLKVIVGVAVVGVVEVVMVEEMDVCVRQTDSGSVAAGKEKYDDSRYFQRMTKILTGNMKMRGATLVYIDDMLW